MTLWHPSTVVLGLDLETLPIGPGAVYPRPMCATLAWRDEETPVGTHPRVLLVSNGDAEWGSSDLSLPPHGALFESILDWLLEEGWERRRVRTHNGHGFDWPVIALWFPRLIPKIFRALERGQLSDTITREKLLNLAIHGIVDTFFAQDGTATKVSYRLDSLTLSHLGIDRTAAKGLNAKGEKERDDVWRLNFGMLDGVPSSQYPPEASSYALDDAADALLVGEAQDAKAHREFTARGAIGHDGGPFDVFLTEPLHVAALFCLSLATHEGFRVDEREVEIMEREVAKARRPEQTELLFTSGLRSRPLPARPYANGARHGVPKPGAKPCACAAPTHDPGTPKWVGPEPSHLSKAKLLELVVSTWEKNRFCDEEACPRRGGECAEHGLPPLKRTDPSKTFPEGQISCDGEVIEDLAGLDETGVLAQHDDWTVCEKLETLEIPRLRNALVYGGVIHGVFHELKKTGRVSASGSKLFPSINVTQIPRGFEVVEKGPDLQPILKANGKPKTIRIEPRNSYLPVREGWVLVSVDWSFVELVSHAQKMQDVIGYSRLGDAIRKGFDPHAHLGSRLAWDFSSEFRAACEAARVREEDDVYRHFLRLKGGSEDEKAFYKQWRQHGKSTGLSLPGGQGPRTLISTAKKVYGVVISSLDQAKAFKESWLNLYPENREYHQRYARTHLRDEAHEAAAFVGEDGKHRRREKYAYFTTLGMYRSNCLFTEGVNGFSLQGPSSEALKLGVVRLQRAFWDPTVGSCLYGSRLKAAIHDECLFETPNDAWLPERAQEAARIWRSAVETICPDVPIKAEPAAQERWLKAAEAVYSRSDGRLRVWRPDEKYDMDEEGRLWTA